MESAFGKKILLINGHPWKNSFCAALAAAYARGAGSQPGIQVQTVTVRELEMDFTYLHEHQENSPTYAVVKTCQEQLLWADHLVFVFPTWWTNMPAMLKGFIDQVFATDVAYRYQSGKALPEQLLKGKTARILVTMDAPVWWNRWVTKAPQTHALKKGTLEFCGVKPVKVTVFDRVRDATPVKREKWLETVHELAKQDVR